MDAAGERRPCAKYRHLLDETPGLARDEQALLAVLALRGSQTPGELKARVERMQRFDDLAAMEEALGRLIARDLVVRRPRRPGQKEERYAHRLSDDGDEEAPAAAPAPPPEERDDRLARLERQVAALAAEVAELRRARAAPGP